MRRVIDNDLLTMASRLIVGGVFIYASVYKIADPLAFAGSIWNYHLAPGWLINFGALVLPWVELVVGLGLILGLFYRGSALLVNGMTIMFIVALASTVARGLDIDCGCFKSGQAGTGSAKEILVRDFGLLALTLQIWFSRSRKWLCMRS
ncbi:MAG: DoxX family membrane protein [candidate division Zixibacteria bacterium]|nr:DoxX family membrane protein [candidate division Zixibacteria bacterium]MDH3937770.1 DoxX family membrane protein [candidate division Zixibacteria bacterium]MDH4033992.1 DoxX family membrane protein [candidate division Zixibacteria bacterium]